MTHYHVRWMIRRDMTEILQIEAQSFANPWDEEEFVKILRQRNCIGMVAEHDSRVVGFVIYELHKFHIEFLNLAVAADMRGRGVGRALIGRLIGKLSLQGNRRTMLRCRISEYNDAAIRWLSRRGLRAKGIDRQFLTDDGTSCDAIRMEYRLDDREADRVIESIVSADGKAIHVRREEREE